MIFLCSCLLLAAATSFSRFFLRHLCTWYRTFFFLVRSFDVFSEAFAICWHKSTLGTCVVCEQREIQNPFFFSKKNFTLGDCRYMPVVNDRRWCYSGNRIIGLQLSSNNIPAATICTFHCFVCKVYTCILIIMSIPILDLFFTSVYTKIQFVDCCKYWRGAI